jgi:glutaryl-CoA dehydrogenase
MVLPSLCESHFYRITGLLDQKERAIVKRVRDFMEAEVAPIIEDYWGRSTLTLAGPNASDACAAGARNARP